MWRGVAGDYRHGDVDGEKKSGGRPGKVGAADRDGVHPSLRSLVVKFSVDEPHVIVRFRVRDDYFLLARCVSSHWLRAIKKLGIPEILI